MNGIRLNNQATLSRKRQEDRISFQETKRIWKDPNYIESVLPYEDELRHLVIGKMSDKHWAAIITYRGNHIRIISVRRARSKEVK